MLEHLPLIVFLVTFVLIFVLRMPIPAGMIAACTLYFLTDGLIKGVGFGALITGAGGSLHLVAQKTIEAIFTNGTIVAVPLFIFAANVMNAGKITEYVSAPAWVSSAASAAVWRTSTSSPLSFSPA